MELSILYIREVDLKSLPVGGRFSELKKGSLQHILVKLNHSPNASSLLEDVLDIRKKKVFKRIEDWWFALYGSKEDLPTIHFIKKRPVDQDISIDFVANDELNVFCDPHTVDSILPFVYRESPLDKANIHLIDYTGTLTAI